MKKRIMRGLALSGLLVAFGWVGLSERPAWAQHESNAAGQNLPQNYTWYADVTISAAASPTPVLSANPNRVSAVCADISATNPVRVGDSSIGAAQGTLIPKAGGLTLDVTSALYAYSAAGETINCGEIVRP